MSLKLIVQFKDSVEQERINSILQSEELRRIKFGSGLRMEKILSLSLDSGSEELRRLARSYEFNEIADNSEKMSREDLISIMRKMKGYLEIFDDIYFMQIETQNGPIEEPFKNYGIIMP